MDRIGTLELFLINIVMALLIATGIWGIDALIAFGIVTAPIYLFFLVLMFWDGAFGLPKLTINVTRIKQLVFKTA